MKEAIEKLIKEFNPERKEVQDESFDPIEVNTTGPIDDVLKSINSAKKKGATAIVEKSMFSCLIGGDEVAIKTRVETDKEYKARCDELFNAELEKIITNDSIPVKPMHEEMIKGGLPTNSLGFPFGVRYDRIIRGV